MMYVRASLAATLLLVLLILTGCGDNASQPAARTLIKGKVVNASSGAPVVGAFVTTDPPSQSVVTDTSGAYQIDVATIGLFVVMADKEGYDRKSVTVQTVAGQSTIADIGIAKRGEELNDNAPLIPDGPRPPDKASQQPLNLSLYWNSSDADGDPLAYDLYFGTTNPPKQKLASNISTMHFPLSGLDTSKTYYWFVVAKDNHDATVGGPVWRFTTGSSLGDSNALWFNGESGYLLVPHSSDLAMSEGNFTVEAWVRTSDIGQYAQIINRANSNDDADFMIFLQGSRVRVQTRRIANSLMGATDLKLGTWYHIAAVQNVVSGTLSLYVNGKLDGQSAVVGAVPTSNADIFIGARNSYGSGSTDQFFTGVIQDVRIWNVARSQATIAGAMTMSLTGKEPGLLANWKLQEGVGNVAGDNGQGNYHASLKNGLQWIKIPPPGR